MRAGTALLLFAALALLGAALHPGVVDNVDSRIVLATAERLLDAHSFGLASVPDPVKWLEWGGVGPDGLFQMKFGAGNALLAAPFVALGRAVLVPLGLDVHRAGEAAAAFASVLWFALSGVLVLRIARRVVSERAAVGAALLHAVCSYALVYGRSAYLETPLTCAVLLAFDAALAARATPADPRPAWVLGGAAGAVLWIKHAAVLLVVGALVTAFVRSRHDARDRRSGVRTVVAAAVPAAVLGAAWLALNQARFGSPFETGYSGSARFDQPVGAGVLRLFFSERGGLLLYAPAALVGIAGLPALARRDRGLAWGTLVALVLVLPLYAAFFSPYGGDAWGPRYLLPNAALLAVPAAVALSALASRGGVQRAAAAAIVAAGFALQVPPSLVSFTEFWTVARRSEIDPPYRPGPAVARLLQAKLGVAWGSTWDDVHRGVLPWAHPATTDLDLWPLRVRRELPRHATLAWGAWGLVAAGALCASALLARRTRESAP